MQEYNMIITYDQDKKIITHPSGVVIQQSVSELDELRDSLIAEKNRIEEEIAKYDLDKAEISAVAISKQI